MDPAVVCRAVPPYHVIYANSSWQELCGFTSHEMLGRSLRCLQGPATNQQAVNAMMNAVEKEEAITIPSLVNYDKQRRPFVHTVSITPLTSADGSVEHFRATSSQVSLLAATPRVTTSSTHAARGGLKRSLDDDSIHFHGGAALDKSTASFAALFVCDERMQDPSSANCAVALTEHRLMGSPMPSLYLKATSRPMSVLTSAEAPFAICWASPGWLDVCGFSLAEIMGGHLGCIQGPATDRIAIGQLMDAARRKKSFKISGLVNYDKKRRPFRHTLTIQPISASEANLSRGGGHCAGGEDAPMYFRAESTNVALSCGGIFEQGTANQQPDDALCEETLVWGEEYEEFMFNMGSFASALELRSSQ